jgi:hypothetical protein
MFFGVYTSSTDVAAIEIESDQIYWYDYLSSSYRYDIRTTQVLRDPSAWYHIMCVLDTTQATSSNRNKIYINGSLVTALTTATYPTQNLDGKFNTAVQHSIGTEGSNLRLFLDAYQTETYFIDGQALTPSSFGFNSSDTGVWSPKQYTGPFGTNGFYVNFSDNSNTTAATLGKDYSGNGNNWTPNNFSVTAGAGNDSLVDSPTAYGTDTGVGGEVRGNYCTLNPAVPFYANSILNGNLQFTNTQAGTWASANSTIAVTSGKWYWEATVTTLGGAAIIGISAPNTIHGSTALGQIANDYAYLWNGDKQGNAGSASAYGATYTTGDVIGVALDLDAGTLVFYKNNSSQGTAFSSLSGTFCPAVSNFNSGVVNLNFGQRAFAYTAPSGFKALVTTNLPTPTIGATSTTQANDYFDINLWTGTGATNTITNSGSMQPDFVWIKSRSTANSHRLFDAVRGATKTLSSNDTAAEATESDSLTSFNSNGFTLGADTSGGGVNVSTRSYVGWQWNAGGSNATNTSGTITSTVRANTTSGFSVVGYTGTGVNATVGHGLGVAPSMVIVKCRNNAGQWWPVWHTSLTSGAYILALQRTDAQGSYPNIFNSTIPTSSVFSVGTSGDSNGSTFTYVAYCFAPVAGYSAFGSYTGNGSADGAFIYTGFRPRFILFKESSASGNDWYIFDSVRSTYNVATNRLFPNSSAAEATNFNTLDILSNGWKLRDSNSAWNGSGSTYIYAAFAENPFKYSLAR